MNSFKRLNTAWQRVEEQFVCSFQIGPFAIHISSTSKSLASILTRAFEHLPKTSASPDLRIRLWREPKLPPLDWNLIYKNGYRGYAEPPFYFHFFEDIGALSAIDVKSNIAYYAIRDLKALPWWVSGSPLQVIFHIWLREKGMQLTHSASVSNGKSAVLLAGKGGSGKSTTVLACLQEGLGTLGEDYLVLAPKKAYSIYQTAKWQLHTRTLFSSYESHIANPDTADQEKALLYYKDFFPSQLILSSHLDAIVSLQIGSAASLQKSDLRTSLQSLLLSTVMQLPHSDANTASLLEALAEPLAHYRLILGSDLQANIALLRSLLS